MKINDNDVEVMFSLEGKVTHGGMCTSKRSAYEWARTELEFLNSYRFVGPQYTATIAGKPYKPRKRK